MVSRVLREMDHNSWSIYKKLCDLDRDLRQIAFILLTQKFPLVGYIITGQQHTSATLKSSNVFSLFQCRVVSSPLYVLENQSFERVPIFKQDKLQFIDQVTRKAFPCSIKATCKSNNFDQPISLDADGDESYGLTPFRIKAQNPSEFSRLTKLKTALPTRTLQHNNSAYIVNTIGLISLIR